jgi:organic radical activating enzyme
MGKAAYFIRIGGCDIGCRWCDSKMTWNPQFHPLVHIDTIVTNALNTPANAVVVTGGEPSLYNLEPLTTRLKEHGIDTFLETAGTNPITGIWDWICLSPKRQSPPLEEYYKIAHELKVIIYEDEDYPWAEECAAKVKNDCILLLQPEWSRYEQNIPAIVDYVKIYPKWTVSLQAHKFMHIP